MPPILSLVDHFQGCLLGLAIGDALGMPFEGFPAWVVGPVLDQVGGLHESAHRGLGAGQWTDDTQMSLCLARSLVRRGRADPEDIAREYLAWFRSEDVRGIGATTRRALGRLEAGAGWWNSGMEGEEAAGNGTAMRAAPLGLFYHHDLAALREACALDAGITHRNAEAVAGSQAVAFLAARLVAGASPGDELFQAMGEFVAGSRVAENLHRSRELLERGANPLQASEALGVGGYVVETVARSAFCFFHAPDDFARAVTAAVRGGGDTDTAGAITGAWSGARAGLAGVPAGWHAGVEGAGAIAALARELYDVAMGGQG
ncbi:MAG: ADP-ribosylglycohydrolase family protein [Candidatus Methylomirabilales bacterium]